METDRQDDLPALAGQGVFGPCALLAAPLARLTIPQDRAAALREPFRASLPIRGRDSGRRAPRSPPHHGLGPIRGGVRCHFGVSLGRSSTRAFPVTAMCAFADLPSGGARGRVQDDARAFTVAALGWASRALIAAVAGFVRPERDFLAPEADTDDLVIAGMSEAQSVPFPATIADGPLAFAAGARRDATAKGGHFLRGHPDPMSGPDPERRSLTLQSVAIVRDDPGRLPRADGHRLGGVREPWGAVPAEGGLAPLAVMAWARGTGSDLGRPGQGSRREADTAALLERGRDVRGPSARERGVTEETGTPSGLGIANGPVSRGADRTLVRRGAIWVRRIRGDPGGVTVSPPDRGQTRSGLCRDASRLRATIGGETQVIRSLHTGTSGDGRKVTHLLACRRIGSVEALGRRISFDDEGGAVAGASGGRGGQIPAGWPRGDKVRCIRPGAPAVGADPDALPVLVVAVGGGLSAHARCFEGADDPPSLSSGLRIAAPGAWPWPGRVQAVGRSDGAFGTVLAAGQEDPARAGPLVAPSPPLAATPPSGCEAPIGGVKAPGRRRVAGRGRRPEEGGRRRLANTDAGGADLTPSIGLADTAAAAAPPRRGHLAARGVIAAPGLARRCGWPVPLRVPSLPGEAGRAWRGRADPRRSAGGTAVRAPGRERQA